MTVTFARILAVAGIALTALAAIPSTAAAGDLPAGFHERTVLEGLNWPTAIRFAPDGRVFVAEKDGVLKVFDGLEDPTPEVFADLRRDVNSFGDRGLLGLALDPAFETNGYVYALYTYDAPIGETAPTHAGPGPEFNDFCDEHCEVGGRLVRLDRSDGSLHGKVLIKDTWCQQWSSHSIGALEFDDQGLLYVSGGDGANFNTLDYGQEIGPENPLTPPNPCGDPPGPENQALSPPRSEGGALRSQDLYTMDDPVDLSGTIARVDPATGDGVAANPLSSSPDPNARRVIAYGLRNPFRFVISPDGEIWIGETGWRDFEEIDSFSASAPTPPNFGWPCYEGFDPQPGYEALGLDLCDDLFASPGAVSAPEFVYDHHQPLYPADPCPVPGDGSATAGIELYGGTSFPLPYQGALFFSDYARHCIWVLPDLNQDGEPETAAVHAFDANVVSPVDLEVGPDGALYYVDIGLGEIRQIQFNAAAHPPEAVAAASPTSGPTPLTVQFDGTGSSDADAGDILSYNWDLDGDGAYDDSTEPSPEFDYTTAETVVAGLQVTDVAGNVDIDTVRIDAGNRPPVAEISGPAPGTAWAVGEPLRLIGAGEDPDEGDLDASALTWTVDLNHCVTGGGCHVHRVQTVTGTDDFELPAPDHYYPAHLTVGLTAIDSDGLESAPRQLRLDPRTVELGFASVPTGMTLDVNGASETAPFTVTAIESAATTVVALSPQSLGGQAYDWHSWSDGGARVHDFQAVSAQSLTATFEQAAPGGGGGNGGGGPPPDSTEYTPSLDVLKLRKPKRAGRLAEKGVRALVRCSRACKVTIKLRGDGAEARKAGLDGKIGRAHATLGADVGEWVDVHPRWRARRRLLEEPDRRVPWIVPRFQATAAG